MAVTILVWNLNWIHWIHFVSLLNLIKFLTLSEDKHFETILFEKLKTFRLENRKNQKQNQKQNNDNCRTTDLFSKQLLRMNASDESNSSMDFRPIYSVTYKFISTTIFLPIASWGDCECVWVLSLVHCRKIFSCAPCKQHIFVSV